VQEFLGIVKRLLWPKFHNRITASVVGGGLTLMAAPLWETLVTAFFGKVFRLSDHLPNDQLYGSILIGLGLLYHYMHTISEKRAQDFSALKETNTKEQIEFTHDQELAKRFLALASEAHVLDTFERIGADHSCTDTQWDLLSEIEQFCNLTENHFLSSAIQPVAASFHLKVQELTSFISRNFFTGNKGTKTYLYPQLNVERGGTGSHAQNQEYGKYATELVALILGSKAAYKKLRLEIKKELVV